MKQKNKHRVRRGEEATNLWCTWMGEIHTNFRENGHQLPSKMPWREEELGQNGWVGLGEEEVLIKGNLVPVNRSNRLKVAPFSAG